MPENTHNTKPGEELTDAEGSMLFSALLKQSQDQIYFKDRQSRFVKVSDAMVSRFGFESAEQLLGKTDFDIFTIEHAQQAYDDEQCLMRDDTRLINITEKETWPDGSVTWVTSTKIPLHLESGEIVGLMGITRDITEQIKVQHDLEDSRELLQQKNQIMETELHSAHSIQSMAIPGPLPQVPFAEVSVSITSMSEVSGDVVSFPLQSKRRLSFVLGDISGHGVTAGLFTLLVSHLANFYMNDHTIRPDAALMMLDEHLKGMIPDGFLAALAGVFHLEADDSVTLTLANSCQPPILWYKHASDEVQVLRVPSESAIGLGICESFKSETLHLLPGDCLLFVTDGALEARNKASEEFGYPRLAAAFKRNSHEPIDLVTTHLLDQLRHFSADDFPQDDTTLLAIRIKDTTSLH